MYSFPLIDLDMTPFIHKGLIFDKLMHQPFKMLKHMFFSTGYSLILFSRRDKTISFCSFFFRKKESNNIESYETIRHLLSRDEDSLLPVDISRSWINRFFYFAEPGPITNNDFLCKHGG